MWSMATPAITEHIFNASPPNKSNFDFSVPNQEAAFQAADVAYNNAADLVGTYMGTYGLISMIVALILVLITSKVNVNRKLIHSVSLTMGGLGFIMMYFVKEPWMLHLCFAGVGWRGRVYCLCPTQCWQDRSIQKNGCLYGDF